MERNQNGFGHLALIAIIVVVALIGFAGWYVWQNNDNDKNKDSSTNTTTQETAPETENTTQQAKYVNVIQENGSVSQVAPEEIAQTSEQEQILKVLHETCTDQAASNVTVNYKVFAGGGLFKQADRYAYINVSRCNPSVTAVDQLGGSGAATYLYKDSSGVWKYDFATQDEPPCDKVDDKYPASIVATCYDTSTNTSRTTK